MSTISPLIIKSEELIKNFNLNITENGLSKQSAYGQCGPVLLRITILYDRKCVVFTNITSNQQIIKTA